jgi:hypothetical protein
MAVDHRRPVHRVLRGVRMTLRAATPAHAELRSRVAGVTVVSIVLDLLAAGAAWGFEHGRGEITTFGNALELYAIVVVTSVAGAFASFFHRRSADRQSHAEAPQA